MNRNWFEVASPGVQIPAQGGQANIYESRAGLSPKKQHASVWAHHPQGQTKEWAMVCWTSWLRKLVLGTWNGWGSPRMWLGRRKHRLPCLVCHHHNPDPDKAGNEWIVIHCMYFSLFVRLHPWLELILKTRCCSVLYPLHIYAVLSNNSGWHVPVLVC